METRDKYEYMDENSIHEDLLCPLCTDPLEEPLCANQCGHTFCRKCITHTFDTMSSCPTCRQTLTLEDFHPVNIRPFLNQLNQILVKCKACLEPNIQRGNFKDHIAKCIKTNILCPAADIQCDWTGQRDQLQDHISICSLIKFQPIITELKALIKQQSESIRFLYTILEKASINHKDACREQYARGTAFCDICKKQLTTDEHRRRLHFCPETDICPNCINTHLQIKNSV